MRLLLNFFTVGKWKKTKAMTVFFVCFAAKPLTIRDVVSKEKTAIEFYITEMNNTIGIGISIEKIL